MKKPKILILAITLLALLLVSTLFFTTRTTKNENQKSQPEIQENQTNKNVSELPDNLMEYRNDRLGFSLLIPKYTDLYDEMAYGNRPESGSKFFRTPITVFDNGASDHVYIAHTVNFEKYTRGPNGFSLLDDDDGLYVPQWEIQVRNVSNTIALEKFIKERFGPACKISGQTATKYPGLYDVNYTFDLDYLDPEDEPLDGPDERCLGNFKAAIKYSPGLNRVATWNMGQEANFYYCDETPYCQLFIKTFDEAMRDSFNFIP